MSTDNFDIRPILLKLVSRSVLSEEEVHQTVNSILEGKLSEAAIASFLVAMSMKGETSEEISAILQTIKRHAIKISPKITGPLVDTCGTGGDAIKSFNISTAAAIVASSAGMRIAKHGNRSVSGFCGSADFLDFIGFDLQSSPEKVCSAIENIGIGFLYAPNFHPALRRVAAARNIIGIRTVFNIAGPLSNPCTNITGQVIGVFASYLLEPIAHTIQNSGINDAMIVHSHDGLDELSNTCENDIFWISDNQIKRIILHPKMLNMKVAKHSQIIINSKEQSLRDTLQVIFGVASQEKEDIVVLNASAALVIGKVARDFQDGVDIARSLIKNGKPQQKLRELVRWCGREEILESAIKNFIS
ncbi:MAG TPA: anthranilate phosphoribosyltransferase [Nitrososphaeraceae archaeon]|nr:anthranilate phosphoribosyltransferase [Nitrososphaeraceae archaeon]